ncbi:MAG: DUF2974 domain-containing protein [Clostridia bacterium]|nr:DUF2974 domain-containing protein [Clostridia bacterium]
MANLFDYLKWRGDLSFEKSKFNEVDGLIFAELSYVYLDEVPSVTTDEGISVEETSKQFFVKNEVGKTSLGFMVPGELVDLFYEMSHTERFKNGIISNFVNETKIEDGVQFCAVSVTYGDTTYVCFRGTDDTIVGWEENFNMGFMTPVPAQIYAKDYLNKIGLKSDKIVVVGHSKGGNLSTYAATMCNKETKQKIVAAYNYDGPGFIGDFFESDEYAEIKDRLHTIVPQESIVGMLLRHDNKYTPVKCCVKGITQHNGLFWQVLGTKFETVESTSDSSRIMDKSLSTWLESMTIEERKEMVDILFTTMFATNSTTLVELSANRAKLWKALSTLDRQKRDFIIKKLSSLFVDDIKKVVIDDYIKPRLDEMKEKQNQKKIGDKK